MADEGHTAGLARFIASFRSSDLPASVRAQAERVVLDGTGAIMAAVDPAVSTGRHAIAFAAGQGGSGPCTLIGGGALTDATSAALSNGTLGYACDVEPFHPGAVLHPVACILPAALAAAEIARAAGAELVSAVALGCEVAYRVSMAIGPVEQYNLGFHPSAVCGGFGAAAAAAHLLDLDDDAASRALGLVACQASGLMAWESDPTENARPFQLGVAARNGITAALLAARGFGGPSAVFDRGHTVLRAFGRDQHPERLREGLGQSWAGVTEIAIKPYPCVAFLHPGLDAVLAIRAEAGLDSRDIAAVTLRFARSGVHCIDGNPLKSHCAQYVLPVALVRGELAVRDLFADRRLSDPEVARLAAAVTVVADGGELERAFPAAYATVVEVRTTSGRRFERRQDIARGYPHSPLSDGEISGKFRRIVSPAVGVERAAEIETAARGLWAAPQVAAYAALLRAPAGG